MLESYLVAQEVLCHLMPITVDVVNHRGVIRARKPQTELKTSARAQLLSQRATKRINQANNSLLKVSIHNFNQ
jgi:hypothetical protein